MDHLSKLAQSFAFVCTFAEKISDLLIILTLERKKSSTSAQLKVPYYFDKTVEKNQNFINSLINHALLGEINLFDFQMIKCSHKNCKRSNIGLGDVF